MKSVKYGARTLFKGVNTKWLIWQQRLILNVQSVTLYLLNRLAQFILVQILGLLKGIRSEGN